MRSASHSSHSSFVSESWQRNLVVYAYIWTEQKIVFIFSHVIFILGDPISIKTNA